MLTGIKGVIFDLDGTLVDSMWMWKQIDIDYLSSFGIELPDDLQTELGGKSFYETAIYFKERFGIRDDIDVIMNTWNEMALDMYRHKVPLKNNVKEFLSFLKKRGIKTGIATSNSRVLAEAALNAHNISGLFEKKTYGCSDIKGKPAPDIYLITAKGLMTEPENCLVFEDLSDGIRAGKAAGMRVCAVWDEYSKYELEEKKALADYYIKDYGEVFEDS